MNTAFCRAAARLAPPPLRISIFSGMGALPLFNPDLEACVPTSVQHLRLAVDAAQALIIASPEYAHGISGVLKNALDWLVSHEGTLHKPIALINTSPRSHHADDALREVLQTMSTHVIPQASVSIPLAGDCITEDAMLASPEVRRAFAASMAALVAHVTVDGELDGRFPEG